MEENVFEMEYVINGEKYLITATKVTNDTVEHCDCKTNTWDKKYYEELEKEADLESSMVNEDEIMTFSVEDIPNGMDLDTWMSIIENYGIILTK